MSFLHIAMGTAYILWQSEKPVYILNRLRGALLLYTWVGLHNNHRTRLRLVESHRAPVKMLLTSCIQTPLARTQWQVIDNRLKVANKLTTSVHAQMLPTCWQQLTCHSKAYNRLTCHWHVVNKLQASCKQVVSKLYNLLKWKLTTCAANGVWP